MRIHHLRVAAPPTLALLAYTVLAFPGLAGAEPPPSHDFTRDGGYVQAQGLYAMEDFKNNPFKADDSWGFNVGVGYRVAQLFAVEFEIEWVHRYDLKLAGNTVGDIKTLNIGIPFRLYPLARLFDPGGLANRFQPFIKLAPAWQWVDTSVLNDGGFVGRMGGGLDIYLTDNVVLTTSAIYNWPTGDIADLNYLSFGGGLQYRFGGGD